MNTIQHRGANWPVTDHWHEANTVPFPHLAGLSRDEHRKVQDDLLLKSHGSVSDQLDAMGATTCEAMEAIQPETWRQIIQASLTPDEFALLRAANNHYDTRTAIDFLAGRPLSDFGFDGVDQVHGNDQAFKCGCKLNIVFDHHRRNDPVAEWSSNERRHHPHYPSRVCDLHAEHAHDLDWLHRMVHEHNAKPATEAA